MVGFLRKKKSDKVLLSDETALDRKGKVDGSSLLDGNGDPTEGSLFHMRARKASGQRNSDEENNAAGANGAPLYPPVMATGGYPSGNSYGYGHSQPHMQQQQPQYGQQYPSGYGFSPNQQPQQYPNSYGYGQQNMQQQPQQYGQQYPNGYGAQPQQYPVAYGHLPPPVSTAPKKSRFRLPGYGKKN